MADDTNAPETEPLTITSDDELRAAARTHVDAKAHAAKLAAIAAAKISKIKATLAADVAEHEQAAAETGEAIERYATAHRERLLPKGSKTVDVGAAKLSWKKGRESVEIDPEVDVVDALQAAGLGACVSYSDPVVSLTALKQARDQVEAKGVPGVAFVEGSETFSIKAA